MNLSLEDIRDRIQKTEDDMAIYRAKCDVWEGMWRLEAFRETREQALKDNREQVVLPDPKNIITLLKRLVANTPRIDVPGSEVTDDAEEASEARKRFLDGLWSRSNKEQGGDLIGDAVWYAGVRGRFAFDIRWIEDHLPKRLAKKRLPLMIRVLDPKGVGIKRGPLYTLWAYHKYEEEVLSVLSRYPDLKAVRDLAKENNSPESTECEVTDFWYIDPKSGDVWNSVLVDGEFAKKPWKTQYPDIPIIVSGMDRSPTQAEDTMFEPILEPIRETWPYKCRLASQMATGLLWYFWPAIIAKNSSGRDIGNIEIGPGQTTHVRGDTTFDVLQMGTNMPMADQMMAMLTSADQQSTFPSVMFGDSGQMQAGFGVNMLLDSAKGRIADLIKNIEWAVSWTNEMALELVEVFADEDDGVSVWGMDEATGQIKKTTLLPSQIDGFYENHVRLTPNLPSDDIQKQTIGLRQVEAGIISRHTYRKQYINNNLPSTEEKRVILERAMMNEENMPLIDNMIMAQYFQDPDWKNKMMAAMLPPEPEIPPMGMQGMPSAMQGPPPGMMQGPPMPPPGMMPPPGPPGPQLDPSMQPTPMLDPSMPPQMEGMLTEDMMPPGMPPEIYQQLINGQAPGAVPTMDEIDLMDALMSRG